MKIGLQIALAALAAWFLIGCSSSDSINDEIIGSVGMKEDVTLAFSLIAETSDGTRGYSYFEVEKDNEEYENYLAHVAPIKVGETKAVKPWEN